MSLKNLLALLLYPLVRVRQAFAGKGARLWAYAVAKAQVRSLPSSAVLCGVPEIHGTGNIALGENLFMYREIYLETQGDGAITLGDDVVISRGVHIVSYNNVEIGPGTMIGEYTSIRDANHIHGPGQAIRNSGHAARPVRIGCNVWIGRGAAILAGVTIGEGAVVGANAVVNRDVPPGGLVGGVPAKSLRKDRT